MNEFYLFFFKKELKPHLLHEIKIKYPELKLSFSNKSFLSFKAPANFETQIKKQKIIYAQMSAKFIKKDNIESVNSISVHDDEYWHYSPLDITVDTFNYSQKDMPAESPARAYLKMQQAHEIFGLDIKKNDQVIEIGSAPGGISYYLLTLGTQVYAIDPAEMDKNLKKEFSKELTHQKQSVFDIDLNKLPARCDWLISDLNLNGDLNINQCIKILKHYSKIKGAFITLKTPEVDDFLSVEKWTKLLPKYKELYIVNLPAHKKELGFVIKY